MKVKSDHRTKFSNLSHWKEEAWKSQGFNRIRTRDLHHTSDEGGRGGVTPLYELYTCRYVRPQRVWFLSYFGHKYRVSILADFGSFGHK